MTAHTVQVGDIYYRAPSSCWFRVLSLSDGPDPVAMCGRVWPDGAGDWTSIPAPVVTMDAADLANRRAYSWVAWRAP